MKTIQLTPRQRKEIGERRRHAQDRRIYQRLSAVLWIDEGRTREEVAALLGVTTRQVGEWLRTSRNKGREELCTLHDKGDPGRLKSSDSSKRSPRGSSTTPIRSASGSKRPSAWLTRPRGSRTCSVGSGPVTIRSRASSGRPMSRNRSSSCATIGGTGGRRGRRPGGTSSTRVTRSGA